MTNSSKLYYYGFDFEDTDYEIAFTVDPGQPHKGPSFNDEFGQPNYPPCVQDLMHLYKYCFEAKKMVEVPWADLEEQYELRLVDYLLDSCEDSMLDSINIDDGEY